MWYGKGFREIHAIMKLVIYSRWHKSKNHSDQQTNYYLNESTFWYNPHYFSTLGAHSHDPYYTPRNLIPQIIFRFNAASELDLIRKQQQQRSTFKRYLFSPHSHTVIIFFLSGKQVIGRDRCTHTPLVLREKSLKGYTVWFVFRWWWWWFLNLVNVKKKRKRSLC